MNQIIESFEEISSSYKAIFCDLWGCLHDGRYSFPESINTLKAYKKAGGIIILLTNAPRPKTAIADFIRNLGINDHLYDDIVTSGDAAQLSLFLGKFGNQIFHIGPERDHSFFEISADLLSEPVSLDFVNILNASCIVCTGLFNDQIESPSDYTDIIRQGIQLNLELLCVNPDIQVDYGNKRLWCAGAVARNYKQAGGTVHYFGKPHRPIYDLALKTLHKIDPGIKESDIICIGDGISTDILGGIDQGLDTLFVCGGLSDKDTGTTGGALSPDKKKLAEFLNKAQLLPTASIGYFR